jgi:type I restriction enzyme S subunit
MVNGELIMKKGYKRTEIGVIPDDWEVKRLESILKIKHGKNKKEVEDINGKYPILGTGGQLGSTNSYLYNKPSVLIGRKGTIDKPIYMDTPFWTVDTLFYSEVYQNAIPKYLYYNFLIINWYSYNEASGVPSLNASRIESIQIPLPPLPEQKAIAEVLSDTDSLIQALEKRIAKKRLIKQGAMQKLLTPKDDWEVKKLGEIAYFMNGKAHEQFIDEYGDFIVINSKFISTNGEIYKNAKINLCPLRKGDITMVMSDIPNGKALAKSFIVPKDEKYALNQRICALRTEIADNNFLACILNRNKYYLSFDSGTGQTNLKKDNVLECPIPLPPTKEQQTHIATILSDMDSEIEALEKKRAKYKQLKQGLMQNLLTGKIRLSL